MKEMFKDYGIVLPSSKTNGEAQTTCPKCSHTRKKKSDKCLSVNLEKLTWFCHHCGWAGVLRTIKEKIYARPKFVNNTNLSDKVAKWFKSRGISQNALIEAKITCGSDWMPQAKKEVETIHFNYFRNGELINIKYRGPNKDFKMHKDAELIFYNIDCLLTNTEVYIVEGEMDALTLIQLGFKNVISVPNGAAINGNMEYLNNCIDDFKDVERIILCTDNDLSGRWLQENLKIRFGAHKCSYIELGNFKDINEVLINKGEEYAKKLLNSPIIYPVEGVFSIEDYSKEIDDMYINGLDMGFDTGMKGFDNFIKFALGYMTCITGIPNHGKSDFLDQICLSLTIRHGLKGAYFSPENKPTKLHFSKLARKITGKNWFGYEKMSFDEMTKVKYFLNDNIWFIKPKEDFTIENILEKVQHLITSSGLKWFVIDAWNTLEHNHSGNEHQYTGIVLNKLAQFCEKNKVHFFLIAHPKKMQKQKDGKNYMVPTGYDISGSSNFYNKFDNIMCVYRHFEDNYTEVLIQKIKFSHWGKIGSCTFWYDLDSGRYYAENGFNKSNWLNDLHGTYLKEKSRKENLLEATKEMKEAKQKLINPFENNESKEVGKDTENPF